MHYSPLIERLIEKLRVLPGVGPKSAQRMAFYLLERQREAAYTLAHTLIEAMDKVEHCQRCRMLSEHTLCTLCQAHNRDDSLLCLVEMPQDMLAIEQAHIFNGRYFILHGHISPLAGIGPEDLGLEHLEALLSLKPISEVIIATHPTIEGDATAYYLSEWLKKRGITQITRIAHGVPVGGSLDYVDSSTLGKAFLNRQKLLYEAF